MYIMDKGMAIRVAAGEDEGARYVQTAAIVDGARYFQTTATL